MRHLGWQLLLMLAVAAACSQDSPPYFGGPFVVGTTPLDVLPEVSGLVSSAMNPGVLWMHNDSGDEPRIFAVTFPGRIIATVRFQGASHIDWEDIAKGPGPEPHTSYLYVADIGDNAGKRSEVTVYRIREPLIDSSQRNMQRTIPSDSIERFILRYPDGARDAEALLVDPRTGDIVIVTKREQRCRVYSVSAPHASGTDRPLTFRGEIPLQLITGGDVSPDGSMILLKTYLNVRLWKRTADSSLASAIIGDGTPLPYMPERQGEAIGFTARGDGYYTTSECENGGPAAAIMFYPSVPDQAAAVAARDVRLPSIQVNRLLPNGKKYRVRYAVPEVQRILLTVHNAAMFKVMTLAEDSAESGPQERDFDAAKLPPGTYAVVLETSSARVATTLEIR